MGNLLRDLRQACWMLVKNPGFTTIAVLTLALGAKRGDIFRLVLAQGFRMAFVGLATGLVLSIAIARLIRSRLVGVAHTDALTYASVAILLCVVALAACFLPALRAAKVEPIVALRYE